MTFLILHPELIFAACFVALIALYPPPRRFWIGAAIVVLFLPFWPLLAIRWVAAMTILAIDWLTVDRWFTRPLSRAADFLMTKW
jgi:hypothetical protein